MNPDDTRTPDEDLEEARQASATLRDWARAFVRSERTDPHAVAGDLFVTAEMLDQLIWELANARAEKRAAAAPVKAGRKPKPLPLLQETGTTPTRCRHEWAVAVKIGEAGPRCMKCGAVKKPQGRPKAGAPAAAPDDSPSAAYGPPAHRDPNTRPLPLPDALADAAAGRGE